MAQQELVFDDIRAQLDVLATSNEPIADMIETTKQSQSVQINKDTILAMELRWERKFQE